MTLAPESHNQPINELPALAHRTRVACWIVAIALGAGQAWAGRFHMNADGVSYLDIGDAYFRGDWSAAVNAYWSPLYSWLLGLANLVVRPSPYWEFPLAHAVNFLIYIGALWCFDLFLRELIAYQGSQRGDDAPENGWPRWAWMVLGYTLFAWSTLDLINVRGVSPDLLVAATVYLAAGALLRIASRRTATKRVTFIALGVVLGFGYLAKAAMFPLAFVFLLVSGILVGNPRIAAARSSLALAAFLVVASPFVIALSLSKGRPTFGDVGRLNYAWYVNGARLEPDEFQVFLRHWQGEPPGSGTPLHPTRKVEDDPPIYEFASPIGGTYPLWYDPSYWYDGLRIHLDVREQLRVTASHLRAYYGLFVGLPLGQLFREGPSAGLLSEVRVVPFLLLFAWVLLAYHTQPKGHIVRGLFHYWFLAAPGVAALMLYSLVHVEARFIAAFALLVYTSAFAALRLPDSPRSRLLQACIVTAVSASLVGSVSLASMRSSSPRDWEIADGFRRLGALQPTPRIASLQYANPVHRGWARLARARIVAELYPSVQSPGEEALWMAPDSIKARILETFAQTEADVVVAATVPAGADLDGWRQIGETGYFARWLR